MGLFDYLGDILTLGTTASMRQAGNAYGEQRRLNDEAANLRQQGIDYYQRYGNQAEGLRNQAQGGYQQLGQMGLADRNTADYNLSDLYSQYAQRTGLTGFGTPRGQATDAANRTPFPQNPQEQPLGPQRQGAAPQSYGEYLTGQQPPASPYALDQNQSEQLNQQIAQVSSQKAAAIEQYQSMAKQTGGGISPDVIARINDYYDQQANQMSTQAGESARLLRQQADERAAGAAGNLINQFSQQRNLGTQQYGSSLDALGNLSQMALQQGAGAPYGQAAGQTSQDAAQMAQLGQQFQQAGNARLGQLLQLLSFGLSGGFGNLMGGGQHPAVAGGVQPQRPTLTTPSDFQQLPAQNFNQNVRGLA